MKPFKFTLQALYTVRAREEQIKLEKYAQRVTEYLKAVEQLKNAEKEMDVCIERLNNFYKRGGTSNKLMLLEKLKDSAARLCKQRFDEVKLAQQAMEHALQEYLDAKKATDAVLKYRQRQKERYDLELRREEQKMLDEMKSRTNVSLNVTLTGS